MRRITEATAVPRAIAPPAKEVVEPWRSIVHWPELFINRVHYDSRTELETYVPVTCGRCGVKRPTRVVRGLSAYLLSADSLSSRKGKVFTGLCRVCINLSRDYAHKNDKAADEKLPSGSIIHWTERERSRGVPVTCGGCGKKRFMLSPTREARTGLCIPCGRRRHTSDKQLASGSIVHWAERDPDNSRRTMITCGGCGLKRFACPTKTGLCWSCHRSASRVKVEDEKLPSNSIIHWGERNPSNRKRAMITCGGCGVKREGGIPKEKDRHGLLVGLCEECERKARTKNQNKKDGLDEKLPSGSIIHWGEADPKNPNRAPVSCCICGKKRVTTVQKRKGWTGICFEHRGAASLLAIIETATQNSNGQKNGSAEKKQRGGAHNVKWTPQLRSRFLNAYEDVLTMIQNDDSSLPERVRRQASLRGNKPSDVARSYAARLLQIDETSYLEQVLIAARRERELPNIQTTL